jgi:hypothetical protein
VPLIAMLRELVKDKQPDDLIFTRGLNRRPVQRLDKLWRRDCRMAGVNESTQIPHVKVGHSCGTALAESEAFCTACGTPVESDIGPDNHGKAVSAAVEDDGRLRFRDISFSIDQPGPRTFCEFARALG